MALPSLSWGRYITIVLVYWVLVVGGWRLYTTRSWTQRRVREQDVIAERKDPVTGVMILTISSEVNLLPIGALLFGPPTFPRTGSLSSLPSSATRAPRLRVRTSDDFDEGCARCCNQTRGLGPRSPQSLLEPVRGVRLVVDRLDLAVAGAAVQRDRLVQRFVGLEPQGRKPERARFGFQRF